MKSAILVVDDDSEVVATFARWLGRHGYLVRTAPDGEAALRQVHGVDAVILDARMPVLDGLGFLRRVRADGEAMPVAIVTGDYQIDEIILNECRRLDAHVTRIGCWKRPTSGMRWSSPRRTRLRSICS